MFDFRSYFQIAESVALSSAQAMAKAMHKPSLNNKQSMADYAKAVGATGKACFTEEQQPHMIEWSV